MSTSLVSDPESWPHRFDDASKLVGFIPVSRELHAECTFITDEHLPKGLPMSPVPLADVEQVLPSDVRAPHFIFHSAYCCSTMLARAFDIPGVSMGLKEPQILNDLVGWQRRASPAVEIGGVLDIAIRALARPFEAGETTVIKPSIIVNAIAEPTLERFPDSKALLLYAPLESYLQSIAKKGMWGRRWVREVLIGTIADGCLVSGFEDLDLLELTDLQVAALGWLSQHALFTRLIRRFGEGRIRTLDSATLLKDQSQAMSALVGHFGIDLPQKRFEHVMAGPAFTTHSKQSSTSFDARERAAEQANMAEVHGEEIEMVAHWAEAVAQSQGLRLELPAALLT